MEVMGWIFLIVLLVAVVGGVGRIFYQQIFQNPLGKGEEIRGMSAAIPVMSHVLDHNSSDGGGH